MGQIDLVGEIYQINESENQPAESYQNGIVATDVANRPNRPGRANLPNRTNHPSRPNQPTRPSRPNPINRQNRPVRLKSQNRPGRSGRRRQPNQRNQSVRPTKIDQINKANRQSNEIEKPNITNQPRIRKYINFPSAPTQQSTLNRTNAQKAKLNQPARWARSPESKLPTASKYTGASAKSINSATCISDVEIIGAALNKNSWPGILYLAIRPITAHGKLVLYYKIIYIFYLFRSIVKCSRNYSPSLIV